MSAIDPLRRAGNSPDHAAENRPRAGAHAPGHLPTRPAPRLKTVLHAHTNYSLDSNRTPHELVATAVHQGVDCVAVTDHDEIRGAFEARDLGAVRIIVGQEVTTADGDLVGLFLDRLIPPGLSVEETARRIRGQGGLVLAPHPFCRLTRDSLGPEGLARVLPWLDAVEVCNSQNPLPWEDRRAAKFARRHGLTPYVGADVHLRGYLAGAYQWLPGFEGPAGFLWALARAELVPARFGPAYLATMLFQHVYQQLFGAPAAGFGGNNNGTATAPAAE